MNDCHTKTLAPHEKLKKKLILKYWRKSIDEFEKEGRQIDFDWWNVFSSKFLRNLHVCKIHNRKKIPKLNRISFSFFIYIKKIEFECCWMIFQFCASRSDSRPLCSSNSHRLLRADRVFSVFMRALARAFRSHTHTHTHTQWNEKASACTTEWMRSPHFSWQQSCDGYACVCVCALCARVFMLMLRFVRDILGALRRLDAQAHHIFHSNDTLHSSTCWIKLGSKRRET